MITVLRALWVTVRYWIITYNPRRRTFTERYEFPELPAAGCPALSGVPPLRLDHLYRL